MILETTCWTTRNEIKQKIEISKPTYTLISDKKTGVKLVAEMDLINNNIEFQICNETEEFYYNFSFNIDEAIDMFYNKVDEINLRKNN
jgi:hypothetical protein